MARLVINPDSPQAWVQELAPGEYHLGRGEQNDIPLEHATVSSTHCSLRVNGSRAWLKDLGSVSGTFIGNELVEEVSIAPGTVFHLGEVAIRFEADTPALSPDPGAGTPMVQAQPASSASTGKCKWHRAVYARYFCPKCSLGYCDLCVEIRTAGVRRMVTCRRCGAECAPAGPPDLSSSHAEPPSFARQLPTALTYPLQGNGLILILTGGAIFLLLGLLPLIGLIITGYVFNYAKRIVESSANREPAPPDWPEFSNWWDDVLLPYLHLISIVIMSFGPAILLNVFFPLDHPARTPLIIGSLAYGFFIGPMGMLAMTLFNNVAALNPLALVWSICRIPGPYLVAAGAFTVVGMAYLFLEGLLGLILPVPLLIYVLSGFVNLYLMAVAMRILGLLYATEEHRLGWFKAR